MVREQHPVILHGQPVHTASRRHSVFQSSSSSAREVRLVRRRAARRRLRSARRPARGGDGRGQRLPPQGPLTVPASVHANDPSGSATQVQPARRHAACRRLRSVRQLARGGDGRGRRSRLQEASQPVPASVSTSAPLSARVSTQVQGQPAPATVQARRVTHHSAQWTAVRVGGAGLGQTQGRVHGGGRGSSTSQPARPHILLPRAMSDRGEYRFRERPLGFYGLAAQYFYECLAA